MFLSKLLVGLLFTASGIYAQNTSYCSNNICFAVNIPASSASAGTGDIYFRLSAPTSMSWVALGQGSSMTGSNIFFVYANAAGTNVTLAPRLGVGEKQPSMNATSKVTLLAGSGISKGQMVANVRCSNCNSWEGGSMNFTDPASHWIWAYRNGPAIASDDPAAPLHIHDEYGGLKFNLKSAAGGNSANPFLTYVTPASSSTSTASSPGGPASFGGFPSNYGSVVIAHGVLASLAYVILFPTGAIAIRMFNFRNLLWFHAWWMVTTYMLALTSLGMAAWLAYWTHNLGSAHAIIGFIVAGCLALQPITGLVHHILYKRRGRPNTATYPHVWWGRAVITLGIINGGLGLRLSNNTKTGEIAYGVIASVMWLVWMGVIVVAAVKTREEKSDESETGEQIIVAQLEKPGSQNGS
ncbi:hypothetical protein CJF32_00004588 [Rutstroemia sp. NJR-2017a WRK4]|nr:hypothetical protein CJF32_00004588 [Rutstroemia sp. NJR-2017a WRK4]